MKIWLLLYGVLRVHPKSGTTVRFLNRGFFGSGRGLNCLFSDLGVRLIDCITLYYPESKKNNFILALEHGFFLSKNSFWATN